MVSVIGDELLVWSVSRMMLIENWSTGSETCSITIWSTTNPTWTSLELNPTLCSEKLPPTSLVVVNPVTAVKLWAYALQSLGSKSLYRQTLCADIRISKTCVIAHIWFTSCIEKIQVFSWTCCCLLIYRDVLSKWDYVKVKTIRLQGLVLSLFCLKKHLLHLRDIQTQYTRTGFGGMWVCVQRDFWSSLKCMLSQIMILLHSSLANL